MLVAIVCTVVVIGLSGQVADPSDEVERGAPPRPPAAAVDVPADEDVELPADAGDDEEVEHPAGWSTLRALHAELRLGLGARGTTRFDGAEPATRTLDGRGSLVFGVTDRLQVSLPAPGVAYRFGEREAIEVIPWLVVGLGGGFSSAEGWLMVYEPAAGVDGRVWLSHTQVLTVTVGEVTSGFHSANTSVHLVTWRTVMSVGGSWFFLDDRLVVSAGAAASGSYPTDGALVFAAPAVVVGAVQSVGLRPLPLVQAYVWPSFSLDVYASLGFSPTGTLTDRFVVGFSWMIG